MNNRTFFRTMLDKAINNAVVNTVASLVNFCREQGFFYKKKLKFSRKTPVNYTRQYNNRFLFNGNMKIENGK